VAIYVHTVLLMLFGAVIVEAGIKIESAYFWLLIVIVCGIILTYDIITNEPVGKGKEE
jgi:hypothetical protein